jgi:hypothetical protein
MKNRRLWICLALGLFLAASPILLMELTPQPGRQEGAADKVLSVVVGPGVVVSHPLFGIHNLGFFILAPLLNFIFWSAAAYVFCTFYARLHRSAR